MALDPLADAWCHAWTPPDRRPTREFAEAEINLQGDYFRTGRFAVAESRFLLFPFSLLDDDVTRMLNVLKSPRTGGSLLADIWLQKVFATMPGPFQMTHQTDDDAERHFLTKNKPTFEATPINAPLFARGFSKRDLRSYPHMNLYVQGANMTSLQGKGVRYEWNDEVWIWRAGMLNQAFSRTEDFKRVCKILNISQGGDMRSEWELVYNSARRHNYSVRCQNPACARLQPFEFFAQRLDREGKEVFEDGKPVRAGLVWDHTARTASGWDVARAAETTRWVCRHCGHEHLDEFRVYERLAATGDYICLDPERRLTEMSVRWNALVGGDWWRLVKKFLQACEVRDRAGNTTPLEDFYKKELASFWDPTLAIQKVALATTADACMEPVHAEGYQAQRLSWETSRFITADYQDGTGSDTRHLLVTCRAWGDEQQNRSRLLWWGRCNTFAQLYQVQLALKVDAACVAVDGSFETMEVAAQCAKYGWTMLIGDPANHFPHTRKKGPPLRRPFSPLFRTDPLKGKIGAGRSFCATMRWSNPAVKNLLWNLRHGLSRHRWEVPSDVPPEYRDGLDSEVKRWEPKKGSGVLVPTWVKTKNYNHPWDDECMQTVLAVAAGLLTFDIEEDAPAPSETSSPAAPAPKSPAASAPRPPHAQPDQLELPV